MVHSSLFCIGENLNKSLTTRHFTNWSNCKMWLTWNAASIPIAQIGLYHWYWEDVSTNPHWWSDRNLQLILWRDNTGQPIRVILDWTQSHMAHHQHHIWLQYVYSNWHPQTWKDILWEQQFWIKTYVDDGMSGSDAQWQPCKCRNNLLAYLKKLVLNCVNGVQIIVYHSQAFHKKIKKWTSILRIHLLRHWD